MFETKSALPFAGTWKPWARVLGGLSLVAALACGGGGGGDSTPAAPPPPPPPPPFVRTASLSGADEVPANASTARASGAVTVNPSTLAIQATVVSSGIDGTQAHIHDGAKGVAGSVVIPLTGGAGGVWTTAPGTVLTAAQYASLQAGNYYFNIHSAANPAGEIRGQIELTTRFASLDGTQETPANASTASGWAVVSVNPSSGAAFGAIQTAGITGTDAHVHDGAMGVAGPVILPFQASGASGWTLPAGSNLTAAQVTTFLAGGLYANVHTAAFAGGEIRGQLTLASPTIRTTTLSGASEVPANASTASGAGTFSLDPVTLELRGGVVTTGITGVAAHIHTGAVGVAGPVTIPLDAHADGSWTVPAGTVLTPDQFASLRAGSLYVNVHSVAFSAGEIRGQIPGDSGTTTGGGGGGSTGGGGGGY
ncbi:CHRD domain-containing protein [Geothrix sp. 21YS21S-2]|uniref:CHRD domain-containing protein n=1 Tax=Geothrix sp. 21YS21S-2 TaxID=3068893 RepID=UPI0027B9E99B|nr:CHRD domain-containing protein [Geothrix sp. 21YS21S-2]